MALLATLATAAVIVAASLFLLSKTGLLTYIVTHYRWLIVLTCLAPASVFYNAFFDLRAYIIFKRHSAPKLHDKRVAQVAAQVKAWAAAGRKQTMCTARPGWLTVSLSFQNYKKRMQRIAVSLYDILELDTKAQTVRVEPLANMGQLTRALVPLGWTLPVLPEMDDLTVGGVVCGEGVETSSFKHGLFQHSLVALEIVTATGEVVTATATNEHKELFHSIPWSHGSLGFLVSATIRIVPCKPWVRLEYTPFKNRAKGVAALTAAAERTGDLDYVEALAFSKDESVLMTGTMVAKPGKDGRVNQIGKWWAPWFFSHVQTFLTKTVPKSGSFVEYIPLRQYYHRHTSGIFWEMRDIFAGANHPLIRYTLGWLFPPKVSLLKLTQTEELRRLYHENHVVQDVCCPISRLDDCLQTVHAEFDTYPIWLCPMRLPRTPVRGLVNPTATEEMFVDVGVYGVPHSPKFDFRHSLKRLEAWARANDAVQFLYADIAATREEFEAMFDMTVYNQVREKYHCDGAFPVVYDKVSAVARK